jgi:methylmalonyl-CoA mutase N-terminal domain/subunit
VQYATQQAGLDVDSFAPRISFFFNAHNDFFEEIAKFRAARRIWATIMKERFHAHNPKSWMLRFHTQTAGCTLTAQEPHNNAIRVAFQALSAVLGGTQSLHTNSRDEALSLPTEESVKLALRTQQIIGFESGVAGVIDPLGGSYYVERLTADIEKAVNDYLEKVDEMGGALKAIENGYFQKEIHQSAYEYQQAIERGDTSVVGVNTFADTAAHKRFSILKVAPRTVEKQVKKLQQIKRRRNSQRVQEHLKELYNCAQQGSNIMGPIIDCVRAYGTVGEISDTLRRVYGTYQEKSIF